MTSLIPRFTESFIAAFLFCLFAILSANCGDTDTQTGEPITWQDYACNAAEDCIIREVPRCCGDSLERFAECVNKDYVPPAQTTFPRRKSIVPTTTFART